MNDLLDSTILYLIKKGQKPNVIRRYIRAKYKITIDINSLKQRIKRLSVSNEMLVS
jgi:hypothetical protein